jgi:MFS superfamily sulfate permease-like transporter
VVFVAEKSTMITGVILASMTIVRMQLIQLVPHRAMSGMVMNLRESQKKLMEKELSHM